MANWEGKPTLASVLKGYTPPTESALADPIKEHLRTLPAQLATNQAALDNAIASWNKTDFATGLPNPNYRPEAINELAQIMPNMAGMIAYHGTPHNILGKFDISKVGTGEGAQAYGHGMYFAENPEVAKTYRKQVLDANALNANSGKSFATLQDFFDDVASNKGNLYKVDIPDEYIPNMLDWDKPLNQQSAEVLSAIKIPKKAADRYNQISSKLEELQWKKGGLDSPEWTKLFDEAKEIKAKYGLHRSGEELYREAYKVAQQAGAANPSQAAAESLKAQGIPGIRYLDEGSRSAGKGTSNFVVFDPSEVKILEKNSKPVSRKELIEKQVKDLKD